MKKPITGAIAAALALCASAAPVFAKSRTVDAPSPKPRQITETPEGFVIRERDATVRVSIAAPISIPVGAGVHFDAALLHGDNRETADARP